jgi:hypothetical protein
MSYIDDVAQAIKASVPGELHPDADTAELFRVYAVLALVKGEDTGLEDVHDAWAAWMAGHDPAHRSLKPFDQLSAEVQASDQPYLEAILEVAREQGLQRARRA